MNNLNTVQCATVSSNNAAFCQKECTLNRQATLNCSSYASSTSKFLKSIGITLKQNTVQQSSNHFSLNS